MSVIHSLWFLTSEYSLWLDVLVKLLVSTHRTCHLTFQIPCVTSDVLSSKIDLFHWRWYLWVSQVQHVFVRNVDSNSLSWGFRCFYLISWQPCISCVIPCHCGCTFTLSESVWLKRCDGSWVSVFVFLLVTSFRKFLCTCSTSLFRAELVSLFFLALLFFSIYLLDTQQRIEFSNPIFKRNRCFCHLRPILQLIQRKYHIGILIDQIVLPLKPILQQVLKFPHFNVHNNFIDGLPFRSIFTLFFWAFKLFLFCIDVGFLES